MIILDTNVLSEAWRPRPSTIVRSWLDARPPEELYLCTPVLAELRYGFERLVAGARRQWLEGAVTELEEEFGERILSVDRGAAHAFGRIVAQRDRVGHPIATMDALIAAIAITHHAMLATRDISDFDGIGLNLVDPFRPHRS